MAGEPYTRSLSQLQPDRPLVLTPEQAGAYVGLAMDLADGQEGEGWLLPLGGSFGLLPNLEVGLHSTLLLDTPDFPVYAVNVLNQLQLYGRYLIFEQNLAAELTVDVPTTNGNRLGLTLNVPGRYWTGRLDLFGNFRLNYQSYAMGDSRHDLALGLDVTAAYLIVDGFFVGLSTGFNYHAAEDADDDVIVPLGAGVGYRLFMNSFLKLFLNFPDISSKNASDDFNGFANRSLQLMWVQAFDLSRHGEPEGLGRAAPAPAAPAPPAAPDAPKP
ncbi:MAG: hypothetical protein GYA21_06130 [Myxococcales bacterium]|nr:hypothetical protein [Myxococcales bacterium]